MSTSAPRIFVSHSHQDDQFTARLVDDLRQAGAEVWVDVVDITSGNFQERINAALDWCEWFVLVMTPAALKSPWVGIEVSAAINLAVRKRIRNILPVLAQAVPDEDIPPTWHIYHRHDAVRNYSVALAGVLRAVGLTPIAAGNTSAPTVFSSTALPPPGPAPAPSDSTPAYHLTPTALYNLGFRGYARPGVEFVLPPRCPVPGGVFAMGSDRAHDQEAEDNETPQNPVEVGAFAIGQQPVTVAEYACAVRAKAVREPPGYTYDDTILTPAWLRGKTVGEWDAQLTRVDHPVVCVSWDDVTAYCAWLAKASGQPWRLPTEAEWEKAARWDPAGQPTQLARIYPWGDAFHHARTNTSQSGLERTAPVGSYSGGASPCGAQDMVGNVWEWTSSVYKSYPYNARDGRERADSTELRVLRGGSWEDDPTCARAARRLGYGRGSFDGCSGFRLACVPAGS